MSQSQFVFIDVLQFGFGLGQLFGQDFLLGLQRCRDSLLIEQSPIPFSSRFIQADSNLLESFLIVERALSSRDLFLDALQIGMVRAEPGDEFFFLNLQAYSCSRCLESPNWVDQLSRSALLRRLLTEYGFARFNFTFDSFPHCSGVQ